MNGLVCRERQAEELFFVIGPPGSGKTSQAIRSMVEEELRQTSQGKILLMAYTNRAVDELCGMLEGLIKEHPDLLDDYVRFGSPLSAAENYRSRLLNQRCDRLQDTSSVLSLLSRTRVFVGTAVMLTSLPLLFEHMTFGLPTAGTPPAAVFLLSPQKRCQVPFGRYEIRYRQFQVRFSHPQVCSRRRPKAVAGCRLPVSGTKCSSKQGVAGYRLDRLPPFAVRTSVGQSTTFG